jgi:hypothetical protein
MRLLIIALIGLLSLPVNAQDTPAPFGLSWLLTAEQVRELGVSLNEAATADFGTSYTATNLPKALADLETVFLSFGYDDRLYRVAAISREFSNDQYGISVRKRYDELAAALGKAYTPGEKHHRPSTDSFFGKPENFSYALSRGEAYWFSLFSSSEADIELSVGGSGSSDAYWRLIYTHRQGEAVFAKGKAAKETDAL